MCGYSRKLLCLFTISQFREMLIYSGLVGIDKKAFESPNELVYVT